MGLRFRKSITICKGLKMNFSTRGVGMSFGTRGLRYTINSRGRRTSTIGIPGTGLSYTSSSNLFPKSSKSSRRKYSSQAYLNKQRIQVQKEQEKANELRYNQLQVEEYNALVEMIQSIHKECDEQIDWAEIKISQPPYNKNDIGNLEKEAVALYQNYKPNMKEAIFKSKQEQQKAVLLQNVEEARRMDLEEYGDWENLVALSEKILEGDIDAYFQVIAEMNPLDDLLEFGSDFEFGTDNKDMIHVEFRVKSEVTVPQESLSLTKTGKLSTKKLSKTAYYDIMQDYVCSCVLRIARDMFALLPLKTVVVHAVDTVLDTTTGFNKDITILSVAFNKAPLMKLNFESLDPSDSMVHFIHNMKFMKTSGFKAVERIG